MPEPYHPQIDEDSCVVIRQAREADAGALATLYQFLVSDPHINVRPERLETLAPRSGAGHLYRRAT